jgi:hypothetical protein
MAEMRECNQIQREEKKKNKEKDRLYTPDYWIRRRRRRRRIPLIIG